MSPARARAATWSALLALSLGLAGCPEPEPTGDPLRFEVGTGLQFTPIEEGGTLELVRGGQGGQHVFVSMRVWDLTTVRARVEMSLERTSDGVRVSSPYSVDLRFSQSMMDGEPAELEGLLLMVPDSREVVGQQVRLKASFLSTTGEHGADERTATLQWDADSLP